MTTAPWRGAFMAVSFRALITRLSVRVRIILLALLPVAGFLANGVAYVIGEREVQSSFDSFRHMAAVSESSHEFKAALDAMRIQARDFSAHPSGPAIDAFKASHAHANRVLAAIDAAVGADDRPRTQALSIDLAGISRNFDKLVEGQRELGFTAQDGLRRKLYDAARTIE